MARAWAWGVEPIPASLENRPRFAPWLMAVFSAAAEAAADDGLGLKGIFEDHAEGGGDVRDARYEDHKAAYAGRWPP